MSGVMQLNYETRGGGGGVSMCQEAARGVEVESA